jgi:hypothetical protein
MANNPNTNLIHYQPWHISKNVKHHPSPRQCHTRRLPRQRACAPPLQRSSSTTLLHQGSAMSTLFDKLLWWMQQHADCSSVVSGCLLAAWPKDTPPCKGRSSVQVGCTHTLRCSLSTLDQVCWGIFLVEQVAGSKHPQLVFMCLCRVMCRLQGGVLCKCYAARSVRLSHSTHAVHVASPPASVLLHQGCKVECVQSEHHQGLQLKGVKGSNGVVNFAGLPAPTSDCCCACTKPHMKLCCTHAFWWACCPVLQSTGTHASICGRCIPWRVHLVRLITTPPISLM